MANLRKIFSHTLAAIAAVIPVAGMLAGDALAAPVPVSLYGVEIGAPFKIEPCPEPGGLQTVTCYQRFPGGGREPKLGELHTYQVYFAPGGQPSLSKERYFVVQVADGNIEEVAIYTKGVSVQADTMKQLMGKFGKPSNNTAETLQNRFGAKFDRVGAAWDIGKIKVTFAGFFNDDVDQGLIAASSEIAQRAHAQQSSGEPKL